MHISTLTPAESFDDLFPPEPATGLTDADLRAFWYTADDDAWRAACAGLSDEEYRAFLAAGCHDDAPDEDDDAAPDGA